MSEVFAAPARSRSAWKWVTLADVGKVITGNTPPTADAENYGDAIPFVKPTELVDRGIRSAPSGLAPQAMGKARVVPAGAVLVSCIGNLGKTGIAKVPVAFNQQINVVVFNDDVIPEFGFYFAQTLKPWLYGESSATTIPIVNKGKFQQARFPLAPMDEQREIVAELEKQFSRLDEAVANLQRVKANLKRYERATIASLTNPESFDACVSGTIADIAISLDNMRKPVNKLERAKRPGNIPYLGANGQTGWIDVPLFDEELVLVVEDETFVGRTDPFCYYFADPCWVNNHTHVLRARPEVVSAKYLNLALSYYPFIPLTTGSTGRRKLTKAALMTAPISVPSLKKQAEVIDEVERCLSIAREVEAEVDTNLKRAQALRQATLAKAFAAPTQ